MGYRQQKSYSRYNNRFATTGGYDSTGRWRSEAWHMDGGANDEGWHQAYCNRCGKVTEQGRGSGCVPCGDRRIATKNHPKTCKHTAKCPPNTSPHIPQCSLGFLSGDDRDVCVADTHNLNIGPQLLVWKDMH